MRLKKQKPILYFSYQNPLFLAISILDSAIILKLKINSKYHFNSKKGIVPLGSSERRSAFFSASLVYFAIFISKMPLYLIFFIIAKSGVFFEINNTIMKKVTFKRVN
ncbi:hypothetical protein BpHYR1_030915 [Brachionus plicatilis]|uniref:Uncharacterized protein n=1 Tax=Brachionus plicatilis TaxID=10195 RepID=A0A3M7T2D7_BRAPC|nr:hypothetical protein BpHYR1_030915 [Brachionus plicatilis]